MATKLDQKFASSIKEGVQALFYEVERLERYCEELEAELVAYKKLEEAARKFIGHPNFDELAILWVRDSIEFALAELDSRKEEGKS